MADLMRCKFDKYWFDYSVLLSFAAILDPRFKLKFLRHLFKDLYEAHMVETKVQEVYYVFVQLFNHYKDPLPTYSSQGSSNSDAYRPRKTSRVCANFVADVVSDDMGKSELELYLELPLKPCNVDEEFDILGYWKEQSTTFPNLRRIAKDILAIPITTVASESSFSMGDRVLNRWRSSLLHKHVEALITTRNWLYGYAELEKDGVDIDSSKSSISSAVDVMQVMGSSVCSVLTKGLREQSVQLLFETFNVSGFYAAEQGILSLYAVGRISGCSVDIGHGKIGL